METLQLPTSKTLRVLVVTSKLSNTEDRLQLVANPSLTLQANRVTIDGG